MKQEAKKFFRKHVQNVIQRQRPYSGKKTKGGLALCSMAYGKNRTMRGKPFACRTRKSTHVPYEKHVHRAENNERRRTACLVRKDPCGTANGKHRTLCSENTVHRVQKHRPPGYGKHRTLCSENTVRRVRKTPYTPCTENTIRRVRKTPYGRVVRSSFWTGESSHGT